MGRPDGSAVRDRTRRLRRHLHGLADAPCSRRPGAGGRRDDRLAGRRRGLRHGLPDSLAGRFQPLHPRSRGCPARLHGKAEEGRRDQLGRHRPEGSRARNAGDQLPAGRRHEPGRRAGRRRRRGQPGQERLPGQHEPRDQDAHERRARHDRVVARHEAGSGPAPLRRGRPVERRIAAGTHQRHPRLFQDRSRQDDPRDSVVRPYGSARRLRRRSGRPGPARGSGVHLRRRSGRAHPHLRRPGSAAPDSAEPGRQRGQVHAERRSRGSRRPGLRDRYGGSAALLRERHRHRHSGRQTGHPVPEVHPGGRVDDPPLRRNRARPGHLQAAGGDDGRRDRRRQRRGRRLRVLVHSPNSRSSSDGPWPSRP